MYVIVSASFLCILTFVLAYIMKFNEGTDINKVEFSHLMIYDQEPNITENRKRRRSWDIIDKEVILKRFQMK